MTVSEYLETLEKKNPGLLSNKKVEISCDSLKALIEQAFQQGRKNAHTDSSMFEDIFGDMGSLFKK